MNKKILFSVLLTVFIDMLGFGILIPVIPQLLTNPSSSFYLLPAGFSVNYGYILLGFLTAIFPFMQFIATPILGELSDRFGRKPILAISLFGTSISYIIFAIGIITKNLPLLFISRAFDGVTGGNIAVAQAVIADSTTPENRVKNFGLMGAVFGLGFILGPFIGGKLSSPILVSWFNASTPFWFAAILAGINTILVIYFLPETLKVKSKYLSLHISRSLKNIAKAFAFKELRPIFATLFLFQSGFAFFTTFFSVFLITKFSFNQGSIGNYFAYVGIWIAFSQAVITKKFSHNFSERQILSFSLFGTGAFILMQFVPTVWWGLLLITPFFAIFTGLSQANLISLVSRSVGPKIQGEILGINASVQALAQTIPPIISGFIAAGIMPRAPVFVAGIMIIFSGFVFIIFNRTHQNNFIK